MESPEQAADLNPVSVHPLIPTAYANEGAIPANLPLIPPCCPSVVVTLVPEGAPGAATTKSFNGSFTRADILHPDRMQSVEELLGHVCMGHIYAVVNTTTGVLSAPMGYLGKGMTCEESVKVQGLSMGHGLGDMDREGAEKEHGDTHAEDHHSHDGDAPGPDGGSGGYAAAVTGSPAPPTSAAARLPTARAAGALALGVWLLLA